MAGTPEKILEYLLETRLDSKEHHETTAEDSLLEDFLLTHSVFFPDDKLCQAILGHYHSSSGGGAEQEEGEFIMSQKKCVIHFVQAWRDMEPDKFFSSPVIGHLLEVSCVLPFDWSRMFDAPRCELKAAI
ncbi:rap guanine nucleotide exchange factor 4 [Aplysia californica]|uniref:Rap guanine nucleotide exchange factor 4 n=1 Tax=Aplysia californica TaxID=6500 RepID=A0ABM0KAR6_APLCA|nr:rap guanine nucleotide exchange factor 4 [Aplysia californica]